TLISGYSSTAGGGAEVSYGGGSSLGNSVQFHKWFIGSGQIQTGTEKMRMSTVGLKIDPSGISSNATQALEVTGNIGLSSGASRTISVLGTGGTSLTVKAGNT